MEVKVAALKLIDGQVTFGGGGKGHLALIGGLVEVTPVGHEALIILVGDAEVVAVFPSDGGKLMDDAIPI